MGKRIKKKNHCTNEPNNCYRFIDFFGTRKSDKRFVPFF